MTHPTRPIITAYCLDWHITNSSAFHRLVVAPLAPYADVRLTAWDGQADLPAPQPGEITLFCQFPPTHRWLEQYDAPTVWIPMADYTQYPANLHHHPHVRVVAFSHEVQTWAQNLGLPFLRLHYFLNPDDYPPVTWDAGRVLLYWNRLGWFDAPFIRQLCRARHIDTLLYRNQLDPNVAPLHGYRLPSRIGKTRIETYTAITRADEYEALLKRANVFIAPRHREGVGMVLLEAMARGFVVIGYDAPTMNEYIQDGVNGILVRGTTDLPYIRRMTRRLVWAVHRRYAQRRYHRSFVYLNTPLFPPVPPYTLTQLSQLGGTARQSVREGYTRWLASIPNYAQFVLKSD